MDLEPQLQLLLGLAFDRRLLQGEDEWRDVPEVVRTSFLLLAKELRRLHRLLAVNLQQVLQINHPVTTISAPPINTALEVRVEKLEKQVEELQTQLKEVQALADSRYVKGKLRVSRLWGELAATAKVSADAQSQHTASTEKLLSSWSAAESQLKTLQEQMNDHERAWRENSEKTLGGQVEDALRELVDNQRQCRADVKRLQRALAVHDQKVSTSAKGTAATGTESATLRERLREARQRQHKNPGKVVGSRAGG